MRTALLSPAKVSSNYEIRGIVEKGFQVEAAGQPVFWENIGDPVQKGMKVPDFIKNIVAEEAQNDASYAYCDSKGVPATRRFLAGRTNQYKGIHIEAHDITFFNGLGDAIARLYGQLNPDARVLLPSPTYPAHSAAEITRIGQAPLTYPLDPDNDWLPDFNKIIEMIEQHPEITAILIINPDNPTGTVMPRHALEKLVDIAKTYDLFIICDEIYENMVYEGKMTRLCELIGDQPAIVMKGVSKEFPWPGSRCGWLEYYNRDKDAAFAEFCGRIDQGKMTEVCSTTLPQQALPRIMQHPDYYIYANARNTAVGSKMKRVREVFSDIPGFDCSGGGGAFYATISMDCDMAEKAVPFQSLTDAQLNLIRSWMRPGLPADYKIVYYLLAIYGICVVPLSGFNTSQCGFRFTLLEQDDARFDRFLDLMKEGLSVWSQTPEVIN